MMAHAHRSMWHPAIRITLSNAGGELDSRIVRARTDHTRERIAQDTAEAIVAMIIETTWLYPGDTITVTKID
jgi:hypothetical protein